MSALFATRTRSDWSAVFAAVDCSVTPVLTPEEAFAQAQNQARPMVFEKDGLRQFAPPLKIAGFDFDIVRPAPKVGEHTVQILQQAGYAESEIQELKASAVVA
jgi:crotonobetainyl-CoA:carnitine CoA-transferase CaiB-like acyl-CoA transferase